MPRQKAPSAKRCIKTDSKSCPEEDAERGSESTKRHKVH